MKSNTFFIIHLLVGHEGKHPLPHAHSSSAAADASDDNEHPLTHLRSESPVTANQ